MPFRLFNLHEVAEYLHIPEDAIEEIARRGEIPCERQGGRLMFRHKDVDSWASQRLLGLPDNRLAAASFGYKQLLHEPFMGGGLWTALALTLVYTIGWFKVWLFSVAMTLLWSAAATAIVLRNRRSR